MTRADELRLEILQRVAGLFAEAFAPRNFVPGQTSIPVSGRVFDADDINASGGCFAGLLVDHGALCQSVERDFARYFGLRHAILCNSGSSANLLALSTLTSPSWASDGCGLATK